jgi:hypothetical protein
MDELTIGDKIYISSKKAAEITGYAKDYVGQLCREGRVEATLVGRSWYVLEESIREHRFGKEETEAVLEDLETETSFISPVSYAPEVPRVLPELSVREEKAPIHPPAPVILSEEEKRGEDGVANMQSVWKEWFDRRESGTVEDTRETREEEEEVQENLAQTVQTEEYREESTSKIEESRLEENEEIRVIRNRPAREARTYAYDIAPRRSYMQNGDAHQAQSYEEPVRTKIEEHKAIREENEVGDESAWSPMILKALLVGVAIISISITVLATGFINQKSINNPVITPLVEYLGGTRILNK